MFAPVFQILVFTGGAIAKSLIAFAMCKLIFSAPAAKVGWHGCLSRAKTRANSLKSLSTAHSTSSPSLVCTSLANPTCPQASPKKGCTTYSACQTSPFSRTTDFQAPLKPST